MSIKSAHIRNLQRADRLVRLVRGAIGPSVTSQLVQAFLAVALKEGQTLTELAEGLGSNLSTASRQMLDLGERNRKRQPGYSLVRSEKDPMNLRVNRYTLTERGKILAETISEVMAH